MDGSSKQRRTSGFRAALLLVCSGALTACATAPKNDGADAALDITTAPGALRAGDEAARKSDFERALAHYLRGVNLEDTLDGWLRVAAVYTHLHQPQRALAAYLKVLEHDPNHVDARESVGLEYLAVGDHEAGKLHLSSAIESDPRRWRSHNGLGIVADRAGDHVAAVEHYSAALALVPDSPMILNNIGYSRYLSGDLEQAARDFYRATQLRPDYAPAWGNLGMLYARRGWYEEAVRTLARAMDKPKAYNEVGYIAYRNGDLLESEQLLSEAIRLSPTYYQAAYRNLEVVRARIRDGVEGPAAAETPERAGWDAGER
jgi:Flp pilus assembly protein TadD